MSEHMSDSRKLLLSFSYAICRLKVEGESSGEISRNQEKLLEQLVRELSILKGRILLAFDAVHDAGEEQELLQTLEKGVIHTVLENFLRNLKERTSMVEPDQNAFDLAAKDAENSGDVAVEFSADELSPWIYDEESIGFVQRSETEELHIYTAEPMEDEAFCSVKSKLEKALQQMAMTRIQLKEFCSDLRVPFNSEEHAESPLDVDIIRTKEETQDEIRSWNANNRSSLTDNIFMQQKKNWVTVATESKVEELGEIQSILNFLRKISQQMLDLDETVSIKTRENMARCQSPLKRIATLCS